MNARTPRTDGAPQVVTIGVYGFDLDTFLERLAEAGVGVVFDLRQRRGVRGSQYAWANAVRLQAALTGAGISYEHHRELAPTTQLREIQYARDAIEGVGKRNRVTLAPEYRERYVREVLDRVDVARLVKSMPRDRATALLCVERDAAACHRSLVADRLSIDHGILVKDLVPADG